MEGNAISVKIGAETDGIEQGLRSIQQSLGRLEGSAKQGADVFDGSFQKIASATALGEAAVQAFGKVVDAVFAAGREVVQAFGEALDLGGRLNELSIRTGETAGKLLVLEQAFRDSGLSAEQVGVAINKLQNFMADAAAGGDRQTAVMQKLGVSLNELEGKTPTEQMGIFAKAITDIEDPTQRAAAASEVFGEKLGGRLLPLLKDFSPNLDAAREKVGSLEQVMNENAATFDAAGETFDAVKAKLVAFAAGVLSETIPAVQDLGTSLEQVDAAGLGREFGSVLAPILEDFKSILDDTIYLVDALAYEEQKLQTDTSVLGKTYDFVYSSFANFNQILIDATKTLTPFDATMEELESRGLGVKNSQDQASVSISNTGQAVTETSSNIESSLPLIGEFNAALSETEPAFSGIAEQTVQVKNNFSEISSLSAQLPSQTEEHGQSLGAVNEQLTLQDQLYNQVIPKIEQSSVLEEEKRQKLEASAAKLQTSVENQIALNEAIATGNTAEQQRIQKLIDGEAAQARINKLTEEYAKAMPIEEAQRLAEQMVASEQAVAATKKTTTEVGTEIKTVGQLIADMNGQEMDAPAKSFKEQLIEARGKLGDLKGFIGEDLSKMSLSSIVEKLGLDVSSLSSSSEQLAAVKEAIGKLENADPADITPSVDEVGVNDKLEAVKNYLDGLESKPADATPKIDEQKFEKAAKSARGLLDQEFTKKGVDLALNAQKSIGDIRKQLGKEIDLALNSSEGSKILSEVKTLVSGIKDLVAKIEPKLPQQALA